MAEESKITGDYRHPWRPERDGYYRARDTKSGEPANLLLRETAGGAEGSEGAEGEGNWRTVFALQQALGAEPDSAWWPLLGHGNQDGNAYAAFPPWGASLGEEIGEHGRRWNGPQLRALADVLFRGLGRLQDKGQRPHGALEAQSIVFPQATGGSYDRLRPRLTGLLPLELTDVREHLDRRRAGHLLHAAIIGHEPGFSKDLEFGEVWKSVELARKDRWKSFLEQLTQGKLDTEPYEVLRARAEAISAPANTKGLAIGVGVAVLAGIGAFFGLRKGPVPVTVDRGHQDPNGANKIPEWLAELRKEPGLWTEIAQVSAAPESVEASIRNWFRTRPNVESDLWIGVRWKEPLPALEFKPGLAAVLGTEKARREAFRQELQETGPAQEAMEEQLREWPASLGWGDDRLTTFIRQTVTLGVSNSLRTQQVSFPGMAVAKDRFAEAIRQATNKVEFFPKSFVPAWSELTPVDRRAAVTNLFGIWGGNLPQWVSFQSKGLESPMKAVTEIRREAVGFNATELDRTKLERDLEDALGAYSNSVAAIRRREVRTETELVARYQPRMTNSLEAARAALSNARRARDDAKDLATRKAEEEKREAERERLQAAVDGLVKDFRGTLPTSGSGQVKARRDQFRASLDRLRTTQAADLKVRFEEAEKAHESTLDNEFADVNEAALAPADPERPTRSDIERIQRDVQRIEGLVQGRKGVPLPLTLALVERLRKRQVELGTKLEANNVADASRLEMARVQGATAMGRTNLAKAVTLLRTELGQVGAGGVTNRSAPLLRELEEASAWLSANRAKFEAADWTPQVAIPNPSSDRWRTEHEEVQALLAQVEDARRVWAAAETAAGKVTTLASGQDLDRLIQDLDQPRISRVERFQSARKTLAGVRDILRETEPVMQKAEPTLAELDSVAQRISGRQEPLFQAMAQALPAKRTAAEQRNRMVAEKAEKERELKAIEERIIKLARDLGETKLPALGVTKNDGKRDTEIQAAFSSRGAAGLADELRWLIGIRPTLRQSAATVGRSYNWPQIDKELNELFENGKAILGNVYFDPRMKPTRWPKD